MCVFKCVDTLVLHTLHGMWRESLIYYTPYHISSGTQLHQILSDGMYVGVQMCRYAGSSRARMSAVDIQGASRGGGGWGPGGGGGGGEGPRGGGSVMIFCNTKVYTATHCNTLQHTAIHYNALQHTATHCSTLQRTAAHCSTKVRQGAWC